MPNQCLTTSKTDMNIHQANTADVIAGELGRRVREHRIARRMSQKDLAAKAGLARSSVSKIENGGETNLTSFFLLLRALGRINDLNTLLPEPKAELDPFAVLERERNRTRRVRHGKAEKAGL